MTFLTLGSTRLDERWGVETSAKGGRFKLNRDFGGYALTARAALTIEDIEPRVRLSIPSPEKLRTVGDLVHFDKVAYKWPGASRKVVEDVMFTVQQGGRVAFVGAVCHCLLLCTISHTVLDPEWTREIHSRSTYSWCSHPYDWDHHPSSAPQDRLLFATLRRVPLVRSAHNHCPPILPLLPHCTRRKCRRT